LIEIIYKVFVHHAIAGIRESRKTPGYFQGAILKETRLTLTIFGVSHERKKTDPGHAEVIKGKPWP